MLLKQIVCSVYYLYSMYMISQRQQQQQQQQKNNQVFSYSSTLSLFVLTITFAVNVNSSFSPYHMAIFAITFHSCPDFKGS